jgi:cation diffusion facilitator family transporter
MKRGDQVAPVAQVNEGPGKPDESILSGGKRIAVLSLSLNVLLGVAKYLLYLYAGSTAVLAESVHSLTDVVGSLLVIGGISLAEKRARRFPWGLYKVENMASLFLAVLILFSAYEIAAIIYRPSSLAMQNLDRALMALLLMAMPVYLFSRYEVKKAASLNSPTLTADAKHWRTDLAPLAVVAAGILGARFSFAVADKIAAALVLIIVARAGYVILKDSLKSLLDASVDNETLERMREVIRSFAQIEEPFAIQARNSGRFIFVELSVRVSLSRLKEAHDVALDLERDIKAHVPFVERVIVHYEPVEKEYQRYAALLADREGSISEHFGKASFVAFWNKRTADGATISREILENPYSEIEKGKGIKLAEFLVARKVDVLYTRESFEGKGPEYVLADAGVKVRKTGARYLQELIEQNHGQRP